MFFCDFSNYDKLGSDVKSSWNLQPQDIVSNQSDIQNNQINQVRLAHHRTDFGLVTERAMNYLFFPLAFALLIWWGVQRGKMINIRLYPRDRTLLRYQILKEKEEWSAFAERTRFVHDLEFSIVSVCSSPNFTYIFMR